MGNLDLTKECGKMKQPNLTEEEETELCKIYEERRQLIGFKLWTVFMMFVLIANIGFMHYVNNKTQDLAISSSQAMSNGMKQLAENQEKLFQRQEVLAQRQEVLKGMVIGRQLNATFVECVTIEVPRPKQVPAVIPMVESDKEISFRGLYN